MYTIIPDQGIVIRDSDGKVIAPCQSAEDPDFLAYNEWVHAGNQPRVISSTDTEQQDQ